MPLTTAADVRALSAQQLIAELAERGLDISGNDGILRGRLLEAIGVPKQSKAASNRAARNQKRRKRKKQAKGTASAAEPAVSSTSDSESAPSEAVTVVYRSALKPEDVRGTEYAELEKVIESFASAEAVTGQEEQADEQQRKSGSSSSSSAQASSNGGGDPIEDALEQEEWELDEFGEPIARDASAANTSGLSNTAKRRLARLTLAELKSRAAHPEAVEVHDSASPDPVLLAHLKALPNTVAVPQHWRQKRKYLMGKRALEKKTFELPKFIRDTGIAELRDRALEEDANKSLQQRMREKVRPKLGRVAVDYEILHDAFFKHQTKPKLTGHGEVYFEGKDEEKDRSHFRPGVISAQLREALGLQPGQPPPWLLQMQRYGPPPSYPDLHIPGLNAPIPEGASYGYQPGGWGMPPVDEVGQPLYGNPFAQPSSSSSSSSSSSRGGGWSQALAAAASIDAPAVPRRWGEPDSDDEDGDDAGMASGMAGGGGDDDVIEARPEDEDVDEDLFQQQQQQQQVPVVTADAAAVAGVTASSSSSSSSSSNGEEASVEAATQPALQQAVADQTLAPPTATASATGPQLPYQVLQEADAEDEGGIMDASTRRYQLPTGQADDSANAAAAAALSKGGSHLKRTRPSDVVALDLGELEGLDAEAVERKLLQARAGTSSEQERADIDAMLLRHQQETAAKRHKAEKKDNKFF